MNVLALQVFVSLCLVAGAVVLYVHTVRARTFDHADRLALAPLDEDERRKDPNSPLDEDERRNGPNSPLDEDERAAPIVQPTAETATARASLEAEETP